MFVFENYVYTTVIVFIYVAFIQKMIECVYSEYQPIEKIQNVSQLLFIIGFVSIIIFRHHLNSKIKKRRIISAGLYYGNLCLVTLTALNNWAYLNDNNKLLFFSLAFFCFILYINKFN